MSQSLRDLLQAFTVPEDLEEFDPEKHIGDIKDKVDAIEWQMDEWEAETGMILEKWIKTLQKRRQSLLNSVKRLKAYTLRAMLEGQWDELPGNMRRAKVQQGSPTVEISHLPKAEDFLKYPKYVRQEITYSWLEDTILGDATEVVGVDADGAPVVEQQLPIPGAVIKREKRVQFYNAKKK